LCWGLAHRWRWWPLELRDRVLQAAKRRSLSYSNAKLSRRVHVTLNYLPLGVVTRAIQHYLDIKNIQHGMRYRAVPQCFRISGKIRDILRDYPCFVTLGRGKVKIRVSQEYQN